MTNTIADLYVAIDDYGLFYADESGKVQEWLGSDTAFAEHDLLDNVDTVRVVGCRQAAEFLQRIYVRKQQTGSPNHIKIASPDFFVLDGPVVEIVRAMQTLSWPASVGGWHEMTSGDFHSYALIHELDRSDGRVTEAVELVLTGHPAYPAIEFIGGTRRDCCAWLLADLIDPRWYVDPKAPDRAGRLRSRFGLAAGCNNSMGLAVDFLCSKNSPPRCGASSQRQRATTVFHAWAEPLRGVSIRDLSGRLLPTDFLARIYCKVSLESTPQFALQQASQRFLRLICGVWLDTIHSRELFVPEYFFAHADEVSAWRSHIADGRFQTKGSI